MPRSTLPVIHQFAIDITPGDGISNGMLLTRKLLRLAGLTSEIYCADIPAALQGDILPMSEYRPGSADALLVHHGIGNPHEDWLRALPERKFMVFHNITPASLFPAGHPILPMLAHGWQQVDTWKDWLAGSIADSRQNLEELRKHGHDPAQLAEIPLLVDLQRLAPLAGARSDYPRPFTLLFVGRVMPHKNQQALIEAFACLVRQVGVPLQLNLVGGFTVPEYRDQLQARIAELGLEGCVCLTGKVDEARLAAHYRNSDLFVCLSRHEGFGMPLIEAMAHDLPVLAYNAPASNIQHTLAGAGLILDSDEPHEVAAAIAQLMENPALRQYLRRQGRARLAEFAYQPLYERLRDYLAGFAIALPAHTFAPQPAAGHAAVEPVDERIEGPFDSSYSLALVNRELARALAEEGRRVALRATEGPGPIAVDGGFLRDNPDCADLYKRGEEPARHVLRLLYPPRVTGMGGELNVLSCYGWEESALPQAFCRDFNQHLQLITSMSSWVTRTLQDNGITTPIVTVGLGADHILRAAPDASRLPALSAAAGRLTLLHVSSCFPRKGVDVLLAAYGAAFSAADPVRLIIKTFPNPHHDIAAELAAWRAAHPNPPAVELINQDLPDNALRALYQLADVLVAPSRGEGFGLPLAEAMLHRLPVITTARGGQTDFCTAETAWLIDAQPVRARSHLQAAASLWFEPCAEHLKSILREFADAFVTGQLAQMTGARTEAALQLISQRYTWRAVARATVQAIETASRQPLLKPAPRLGCITTWNSACGIATYSQHLLGSGLAEACTLLANDNAEPIRIDGDNVRRVWSAGEGDDLQRLREAIAEGAIDCLLIQFNFSFFALSAFAALLEWAHARGIVTLVIFHSTADVQHGETLKSLRDLRDTLRHCNRLLVHSVADIHRLEAMGLRDNLLLFPHGVLQPPAITPGAAQRTAGLAGRTVLASYGFLLPHKGIGELIEAFAGLAAERADLHLLLVTACYPIAESSALAERYRQRIAAADLAGRVTLITDYLSDEESLAWLAQADGIVFPYQHTQESSSAAVRWGLCTGKPVLCTPLEIFEDVAEAVTFLPGCDVAALQAGLRQALDHGLQVRQQDWLAAHSWAIISTRLRNLLAALLTKY